MTDATPDLPAVPGMTPFVHNVDTAPAYWWLDILWVVLVDGADTGGRYSLMHETLPKGSGAPPHKHTWSDEHFYMLEGECSFLVGEEVRTAGKGDFVFVPRNTRHAFRVDSDTAVFLNGYTPAGLELAVIENAMPAPERVIPPPGATPPPNLSPEQSLDLLHFGVPDWLGDFQNPELPVHFARYCDAVAERYPWVRFYTPVNEIYVAARFSALDGIWNERLKSDRGFVTALKHLTACAIAGCAAIARRRPDAVFVTSETAEYTHDMSAIPGDDVKLENRLRYLSLDLLYGKQPEALIYEYLLDNGMTREEFAWFMSGEPPGHQIMGNDYYGRNERLRLPDGTILEGEDVLGWYLITRRYYLRYYKPLFHTETNVFDPDEAPRWLWKQWANVLRMRRDGVPVLGFTWYSLTDQIDWDIGLKEKRGTVNACGLYDLDHKPRPVASAYRELIKNFGRISPIAHAKMFVLTDEAALLKAVA